MVCCAIRYDLVMETPIIKKVHFPNLVLGYGMVTDQANKYNGMYKYVKREPTNATTATLTHNI